MGRIDYIDDPNAPRANSVVPSVVAIVQDVHGRVLLIHKTDNNLVKFRFAHARVPMRAAEAEADWP